MLEYIKNLLPRLRHYSKDLDNIENFVDKKWKFIDSSNETLSIIFLRDNRVIISKVTNGTDQKTIEGSWELLPNKELYLKRPQPILLEQGFIGEGVLVLQESGTTNISLCCYDSDVISIENLISFLESLLTEIVSFTQIIIDNSGREIAINSDRSLYSGLIQEKDNGLIWYSYEDGIKTAQFNIVKYSTDKGIVLIKIMRSVYAYRVFQGDFALLEDYTNAPDGLYSIIDLGSNDPFEIRSFAVYSGRVIDVIDASDIITKIVLKMILFLLFIIITVAILSYLNILHK